MPVEADQTCHRPHEAVEHARDRGVAVVGVVQHAQGHDHVEWPWRVVKKKIGDAEAYPGVEDSGDLPRALDGDGIEVDRRHVGAVVMRHRQGEPARAAADLEHARAGAQQRRQHGVLANRIIGANRGGVNLGGARLVEGQGLVERQTGLAKRTGASMAERPYQSGYRYLKSSLSLCARPAGAARAGSA
jgi:hypothetical protein